MDSGLEREKRNISNRSAQFVFRYEIIVKWLKKFACSGAVTPAGFLVTPVLSVGRSIIKIPSFFV
jgi:hypothetical protein